MVGKEKTKYVKFYGECMGEEHISSGETTVDLDKRTEDGSKVTWSSLEFGRRWRNFTSYVDRSKRMGFEFLPIMPGYGFCGTVQGYKTELFFIGTRNYLVQMTELPFLILKEDDIEHLVVDRVLDEKEQVKDINMVIVFKDKTKAALKIQSIPSTLFYHILSWLRKNQIKVRLIGHPDYYANPWSDLNLVGEDMEKEARYSWPVIGFPKLRMEASDGLMEEAADYSASLPRWAKRKWEELITSGEAEASSSSKRLKSAIDGEAQASSPAEVVLPPWMMVYKSDVSGEAQASRPVQGVLPP
ncbi:unnamed protein product [Linum trigynum]|uniref:FACT complex subunit n=1 Tax=Linum trigynum TaxID=586398 RepID=A0AAV2F7P9_9ROSI